VSYGWLRKKYILDQYPKIPKKRLKSAEKEDQEPLSEHNETDDE